MSKTALTHKNAHGSRASKLVATKHFNYFLSYPNKLYFTNHRPLPFLACHSVSWNSEWLLRNWQMKVTPKPMFKSTRAFQCRDVIGRQACRSSKKSRKQSMTHISLMFLRGRWSVSPKHLFHIIKLFVISWEQARLPKEWTSHGE